VVCGVSETCELGNKENLLLLLIKLPNFHNRLYIICFHSATKYISNFQIVLIVVNRWLHELNPNCIPSIFTQFLILTSSFHFKTLIRWSNNYIPWYEPQSIGLSIEVRFDCISFTFIHICHHTPTVRHCCGNTSFFHNTITEICYPLVTDSISFILRVKHTHHTPQVNFSCRSLFSITKQLYRIDSKDSVARKNRFLLIAHLLFWKIFCCCCCLLF